MISGREHHLLAHVSEEYKPKLFTFFADERWLGISSTIYQNIPHTQFA
jgi:hypothetical protein